MADLIEGLPVTQLFVRGGKNQCLCIDLLAGFETWDLEIPHPYSDKWGNDRGV